MKSFGLNFGYVIFICLLVFYSCQVLSESQNDIVKNFEHNKNLQPSHIILNDDEKLFLENNPVIKVAGNIGWPPLDFIDLESRNTGFSYDYLQLIAKKTGLQLEYTSERWSDAYQRLLDKRAHLISATFQTEERDQKLIFSHEYLKVLDYFFSRSDINANSIAELKGKRLAMIKNHAHENLIRNKYPELKIILTDTNQQAIDMVVQKQAELVFGAYINIQYLLNKNAIVNFVPFEGLRSTGASQLKIATTKDNTSLISIINKGIEAISQLEKNQLLIKWKIFNNVNELQKIN